MTAAVLLDLDGTLIDSGDGVVDSLCAGFRGAGLVPPDDAVLRSFIGPPIHDSARRVGVPPELHDEVVAGYQRAFAERGNLMAHVFDGVPQALAGLRAAGARLVVATAKPHTFAVPVLEHLGLAPLLDGVFGAPDDESETKGQIIARAVASLGPDVRAVMVGDREHDVEGARENGLPCVGVLWGFGDRAELEGAGARAVVDSPPLSSSRWASSWGSGRRRDGVERRPGERDPPVGAPPHVVGVDHRARLGVQHGRACLVAVLGDQPLHERERLAGVRDVVDHERARPAQRGRVEQRRQHRRFGQARVDARVELDVEGADGLGAQRVRDRAAGWQTTARDGHDDVGREARVDDRLRDLARRASERLPVRTSRSLGSCCPSPASVVAIRASSPACGSGTPRCLACR